MDVTILISLVAIFFAWLTRFKKYKYGLEVSFFTLTVFMAIRYAFGNDYLGYLEKFDKINACSNYVELPSVEIGWYLLNRFFEPIGFFGIVITLTIFEYFVIYRLIKKHVPQSWYWMSVFIFTFSSHLMLVGASMMRQFLSMCIFVIAAEFIVKRKVIISLLLILLASTFHTSALVLLPLCFLGFFNAPLTKYKYIWFAIYLALFFLSAEVFGGLILKLMEMEPFRRYEIYLFAEKEKTKTGLGIVFYSFLFFLILTTYKYQKHDLRTIYVLFALSFFFMFFGNVAPLMGRIGLYFSIFSVVCYPTMFLAIKNKTIKIPVIMSFLFFVILGFFQFFNHDIWRDAFIEYQTIFSAPCWM